MGFIRGALTSSELFVLLRSYGECCGDGSVIEIRPPSFPSFFFGLVVLTCFVSNRSIPRRLSWCRSLRRLFAALVALARLVASVALASKRLRFTALLGLRDTCTACTHRMHSSRILRNNAIENQTRARMKARKRRGRIHQTTETPLSKHELEKGKKKKHEFQRSNTAIDIMCKHQQSST
jgi:hypothetical protein